MKRILVIGGYGGFGARLARRLSDAGHHVLVAGRTIEKARAFSATLVNAEPVVADRRGDLDAVFRDCRPDLVIDAAGPFQPDLGSEAEYHVPLACIRAAIPYLDLADSRAFVTGIVSLDAQAIEAGIAILSGASSVPALSGAVVRHLSGTMDRVTSVDIAISASSRATAGQSVATAILSYAGKPVRLWRGGRWTQNWGWQQLRWIDLPVGAGGELHRRLVALADVPDHDILPAMFPGRPATTFRAGPEFAHQTLVLWALSWLVRWRWLKSLAGLSRWLRMAQSLTVRSGSDCSGMIVAAKGFEGGQAIEGHWTLIARDGDGPEIPTMAAAILAEIILSGDVRPGARHAGGLLSLHQFDALFSRLAIRHETVSRKITPLYARIMGDRFSALPPSVRAIHNVCGDGHATGQATVVRGRNIVARGIAFFMRFPPQGDFPVHVAFSERNGVERWTRDFGGHRFHSVLSKGSRGLTERFGPLRFHFDLPSHGNGLEMRMTGWSLLGIPLPLMLAPQSRAREWDEEGMFHFDVPISFPVIGMIVHYRGWLKAQE
ncbi:MAG TPA: DUF4166 domain-containing protein [Sphingobium sp.]